jgi:hypothetical protein
MEVFMSGVRGLGKREGAVVKMLDFEFPMPSLLLGNGWQW